MFMQFLGCLCKVYAVYTFVCIFIRATVKGVFYRSFVRGSGSLLGCWAAAGGLGWFAAAAGGGGSGFPEFERITLYQIRAYSLENRGYFTLFRGFRCWVFAPSGSSIHTQLKTVPSTSHYTPNYIPQRFTQR